MSNKFIDVRFCLEEVEEEDGYKYLELKWIQPLSNLEPIGLHKPTQEQREGVSEMWAQSDRYWIDICSALLEVIAGETYIAPK